MLQVQCHQIHIASSMRELSLCLLNWYIMESSRKKVMSYNRKWSESVIFIFLKKFLTNIISSLRFICYSSALREKLLEPAKYPGCSGSRNVQDNISDLKAQVAANHKVSVNLTWGFNLQICTLIIARTSLVSVIRSYQVSCNKRSLLSFVWRLAKCCIIVYPAVKMFFADNLSNDETFFLVNHADCRLFLAHSPDGLVG